MDRFIIMAKGYWKKYPKGVEPFQMVTRLLEECGEVASEVNHFEASGIKLQKHGAPKKENLAGEIKQSITALMQIAVYYDVVAELEKDIEDTLTRMKENKLIE